MANQVEMLNYIVERGNTDADFRNELTSKPKETIQKALKDQFGQDIPADVNFNVIVNAKDTYTIALNPFQESGPKIEAY